jgi:hypothetical protein
MKCEMKSDPDHWSHGSYNGTNCHFADREMIKADGNTNINHSNVISSFYRFPSSGTLFTLVGGQGSRTPRGIQRDTATVDIPAPEC